MLLSFDIIGFIPSKSRVIDLKADINWFWIISFLTPR